MAAATALGGGQSVVADVAADPISQFVGTLCTDPRGAEDDEDGDTVTQVCGGGDDSNSWACATSQWLTSFSKTRAGRW